jgi:DNA-binding winged helix-turn-helix (wHTH) protein/TolB-like protein
VAEVSGSKREVYLFGPYRMDVPARRLTSGGEAIALPPKAFELLVLLLRHSDRAMRRTELLDEVWRDTIVEEGSLGWNMSVLRRALDRSDQEVIETVRGYGYRLAIPVTREQEDEGPVAAGVAAAASAAPAGTAAPPDAASPPEVGSVGLPAALVAEALLGAELADAEATAQTLDLRVPAAAEASEAREALAGRARRRRVAIVVVILAVAAALVAVALVVRGRRATSSSARGGPPARGTSLAVLPFENLSGRADDAWISGALAETLSSELTLGNGASTVPQESVSRAVEELRPRAGGGLSPGTLARLRERLGPDLVVVGSYLVVGEPATVRVDLRLQDAADGSTRFAWSDNRPVTELLALVASAGGELRKQLPGAGGGVAPASGAPAARIGFVAPTAALRAYSEGIELRRRFELGAARKKLEEAVAAAPDFVAARSALADLLAELGYGRAAIEESRRALAGAGELAPVERLPIEAKNRELEARWPEAADLWRQLYRGDPSLDNGLALARALSRGGGHAEARQTLDELSRRPPPAGNDPRIEIERGWAERYAQDMGAMEAAGLRAAAIGRKQHSDYVLVEALSLVAWADLSLAKYDQGLAACNEGTKIAERIGHHRQQALHSNLCGWILNNLGRTDEAEASFQRTLGLSQRDGHAVYVSSTTVALAWIRAGKGHLAEALEQANLGLAKAREAADHERELNALEVVAFVDYERLDLDEAEKATVDALALSRELDLTSRIATHLGALGRIRLLRGDRDVALADHEEAVRVNPTTMAPDRVASREIDLAVTRLERGEAAAALELCDRVEKRLAATPLPDLQRLLVVAVRGRAEVALGRNDAARAELATLDRYRAALSDPLTGSLVQLHRARLLDALGDATAAEAGLRAILAEPAFRELEMQRRIASFELAAIEAKRAPSAQASARLDAERRAARDSKLGLLVGEKL